MRSTRTCLWASQTMGVPASPCQWRLMGQPIQVCFRGFSNFYITNYKSSALITMILCFLQEPSLLKSPLGPQGPLWQLLLSQPPPLEPAQASVSLDHMFRTWAPPPPPLPLRLLAQLSRPPVGRPNPSFPLYLFPRPRFLPEAPTWIHSTKRNRDE